MAFLGRGDIPLSRDPSARFLPWLMGAMAYFAALAVAGALLGHQLALKWDLTLGSVVTVQIPPAEQGSAVDDALRLAQALRILDSLPGVKRVAPVPRDKTLALLEPWLGRDLAETVPLPRLYDLHLGRPGAVDAASLEARLGELYPGTLVEDHGLWKSHVAALTRAVEIVGVAVLALVALVCVVAVAFAVRTSVSIHREVIAILHLIGAEDSYIAAEFQAHALKHALAGGILGALLALASAGALGLYVLDPAGWSPTRLGDLPLRPVEWALVAATPLPIAALSWAVARLSVFGMLRRMP